jgi:hypothetical protein
MLAAGAPAPASLAIRGRDSASRRAVVELTSCSAERQRAVFTGRMTRVAGTDYMAMRFRLLRRVGDGDWVPVRNRKLAGLHSSISGVRSFVYSLRLRGLPVGYAYRVRVRFRWYSDTGEVLRRERHRSKSCTVPSP